MAEQFQDPRGEYSKQCPYCFEYITVNHLNRDYCPEKNEIKNFCKNRYKRLKNSLLINGFAIEKPASAPVKITIEKDLTKSNKTIDDSINDSLIERNKKILEKLLGSKETLEITFNQLIADGYEDNLYDSIHDTFSGLKVQKIGRFALIPIENNKVFITEFKQLKI